jgi:hypothetical protein
VKELTSTPERRKAQRREYQAKLKAMTAQCPVCDAPPGDPCWREGDKTRGIHITRYFAAIPKAAAS